MPNNFVTFNSFFRFLWVFPMQDHINYMLSTSSDLLPSLSFLFFYFFPSSLPSFLPLFLSFAYLLQLQLGYNKYKCQERTSCLVLVSNGTKRLVSNLSLMDFFLFPICSVVLAWNGNGICEMIFCVYWDDHMGFVPYLISIVYYINWFPDVKSNFCPLYKLRLGMFAILYVYCWL